MASLAPHKELGRTVEAFWSAFTPQEKIVVCQIKITERGERVLELEEETWEGTQLFYEQIPLPITDEGGPSLTSEEVWEKRDAWWSGDIPAEEVLQWVLDQLQRKSTLKVYDTLLSLYWRLRRPDAWFTPEYIEMRHIRKHI